MERVDFGFILSKKSLQKKAKIKTVFKYCAGIFFKTFFGIFPLKNKVVFSNFSGKRYGDNPKYISEKLHEKYPDIEIVWLKHKGYEVDFPNYVDVVDWFSIKMVYQLLTARVWVDSHFKPMYILKRKGQFFIETWHGGLGFKKIEGDIEEERDFYEETASMLNVFQADLFISNADWLNEIYRRAFLYDGRILKCGYPKNDIYYSDDSVIHQIKSEIKSELGIENKKVILYAPTFRQYSSVDWFNLDFEKLLSYLNQLSNEWVILVKLHPVMINDERIVIHESNSLHDVTKYPDMQKLTMASDVFITDYSSAIFDFALMRRPAYIYASDYNIYKAHDRGAYFDLKKFVFPFASNTDELIENMRSMDERMYLQKLSAFFEEVGLVETADSAEIIADVIHKKMK